MHDSRNFLPKRRTLINCSERRAVDAAPEGAPCVAGHPDVKVSAEVFAAATKPQGEMEQPGGGPPIRLGQCLKCGSTLTFVVAPPGADLGDDDTQPAVMLWQVRP